MRKRNRQIITFAILLTLLLAACHAPIPTATNTDGDETNVETLEKQVEADEPTPTPTANQTATPEPTPTPTTTPSDEQVAESEATTAQEAPQTVGPENFPEDINPLTGLPVDDPDLLKLPPALLSISNFPASARPQAGLNTSPIVFEMTIGEGMTRFLAVFYGQFPEVVSGQTEGDPQGSASGEGTGTDTGDDPGIGPIRSGRLPYEDIRSIYSGFLVMASAYSGVAQTLGEATTIYGSDSDDINSALIGVDQLCEIAQSQAEGYPGSNFNLEGMKFSQTPPAGGSAADQIWVFYSSLNQIQWRYDEALGAYIRYDIKTDGSGEFVMATDRLTGEPVSRENVIIIYAFHDFKAPTLIDIQLTNMPPMKALLFRDGERHEVFWTTQFGEYEQETGLLRPMRFVDADGNPVALKHGRTWVHIVTTSSYAVESEISDAPFYPIIEEEGTGLWLVRYKGKY